MVKEALHGLNVSIIGGGSAYTPGLVEGFIRQKEDIPLSKGTYGHRRAQTKHCRLFCSDDAKHPFAQLRLILTTERRRAI